MSKPTTRRASTVDAMTVKHNIQPGQQLDTGELVLRFFGDAIREHLLKRAERQAKDRSAA